MDIAALAQVTSEAKYLEQVVGDHVAHDDHVAHVTGIPLFSADEASLEEAFEDFGVIHDIQVEIDEQSKKATALITFDKPRSVTQACTQGVSLPDEHEHMHHVLISAGSGHVAHDSDGDSVQLGAEEDRYGPAWKTIGGEE